MLNDSLAYVVVSVQAHDVALPLGNITRIVPATAVQPVPDAPVPICGVATVRGRVLPVLSLAQWLGFPAPALGPAAQFVIVHAGGQPAILLVDTLTGRLEGPALAARMGATAPGRPVFVPGVRRCADGLFVVQDLEPLLAPVAARDPLTPARAALRG